LDEECSNSVGQSRQAKLLWLQDTDQIDADNLNNARCETLQEENEGFKLSGIHQLLVYADDVNMLEGSICPIKENAEALAVASKETGLEVNADKTKDIVMS
jgi:hypothetical protein